MKKIALSILLLFSLSFVFAQAADHSGMVLYNGDLTGARQTPFYLGNLANAPGSTPAPLFSFSTSDNGTGTLELRAARWGHVFSLTRDDPNHYYNMFQVQSANSVGTTVSVYNAINQVGAFISAQSDSYFNGGNLVIGGTSVPTGYKLAVNGFAIFQKVVVKTNVFADYVFDKEYVLPKLDSVEHFILAHHHLPEMPSADSVAAGGLDLASNQTLLVKKIEELTLYTIAQHKEIEELKKMVKELAKKK
jgi:hypothetical protein